MRLRLSQSYFSPVNFIFVKTLYVFFSQSTFFMPQQPPGGQGLLIVEVSPSHSDTPHSVGLLRTSDELVAGTSTWQTQHSQQTDINAPGGIWTHNFSKLVAADPRLRPRGHWDRLTQHVHNDKAVFIRLSDVSSSKSLNGCRWIMALALWSMHCDSSGQGSYCSTVVLQYCSYCSTTVTVRRVIYIKIKYKFGHFLRKDS